MTSSKRALRGAWNLALRRYWAQCAAMDRAEARVDRMTPECPGWARAIARAREQGRALRAAGSRAWVAWQTAQQAGASPRAAGVIQTAEGSRVTE